MEGLAAYRDFQAAPAHKAFAVGPGGAWSWQGGVESPDLAEDRALDACQAHAGQKCTLFARDGKTVFDARTWTGLWGPYASRSEAARAIPGREVGKRFFDLGYRDARGVPQTLRGLEGKVVLLHFWGSWCPPCRKELPELADLHSTLADRRDIAFVFLQVREPIAVARKWANDQRLPIPLADSGSSGSEDPALHLADGRPLADRDIARSFPTTYVLDKHGLVIFAHAGPVAGWKHYAALLRDAADRSGK